MRDCAVAGGVGDGIVNNLLTALLIVSQFVPDRIFRGLRTNSMPRTREEILEHRRRVRAEYGALFDSMAALLFRHDPIGINFDDNTNEYEREVDTILPRMRGCHSSDDVLRVVHEEFVRGFDSSIAGSAERYHTIASEIWQLWQSHQGSPKAMPPER